MAGRVEIFSSNRFEQQVARSAYESTYVIFIRDSLLEVMKTELKLHRGFPPTSQANDRGDKTRTYVTDLFEVIYIIHPLRSVGIFQRMVSIFERVRQMIIREWRTEDRRITLLNYEEPIIGP